MELRQILGILAKRWWVIIPTIFIALTGSLLFSYSQTPIYQSTSTFITVYSYDAVTDRDAIVQGIDTLSGQQNLFVTYCEILKSRAVRLEAYRILDINPDAELLTKYDIACTNLPQTNVILLTVQGPSPSLATRMNEAISLAGLNRANALYALFPLAPLDGVQLVPDPVSPKHQQNAVLGGAFGLILGISAALMIEYLRRPGERITAMSIRNPQIGIYNELYFERRVQEELKRAEIRNRPISMALLRINPDEDFFLMPKAVQNTLIRKTALLLEENIGHGNLIAYVKPMLIGALLIETPGGEASEIIQRLQKLVRAEPLQTEGGFQATFTARAGIVASSGNLMTFTEMYEAAQQALKTSEASSDSQIHLVHGMPRPFVSEQDMKQLAQGSSRKGKTGPFTTNEDVS